jgi:hypothetical protein
MTLSLMMSLVLAVWITLVPQTNAEDRAAGVWVEVEGLSVLGEGTTMQAAQRASLDVARRAAIEKAVGTFVAGATTVRNNQLTEDLIRVIARGRIVEEQILERGLKVEGPKGQYGTYRTRLRAKVQRLNNEHQAAFTVRAMVNRSVFKNGDESEIRVTSSQDAYVYIFNVTEDEHVTILVPNRFLPESFVKAGAEFVFPSESLTKRGIKLNTYVMPGKHRSLETIKVIATRHPVAALRHQAPDAVFKEYHAPDTTMLNDLLRTLGSFDPGDWAEDAAAYEVVSQ